MGSQQKFRQGGSGMLLLCAWALAVMVTPAGATPTDDAYLQGYAAAVLERELGMGGRSLAVHEGVVTVSAAGLRTEDRGKVITALSSIRGVVRVVLVERAELSTQAVPAGSAPARATPEPAVDGTIGRRLPTGGLPAGLLFDPVLADPRWPNFSVGYQRYVGDREFRDVAAVSFGETFPFYRADLSLGGQWEVGLQASVFAIFDLDAPSFDLINADYFVGVPLAYRSGPFSAMARIFHQSSHLGDEFVLRTRPNRVNLSYEGLDAKLSYEIFDRALRLYGGAGYLFGRDPSSLEPWSTQSGFELRIPWTLLEGAVRPLVAADVQNREENGWRTDVSVRAGLQLGGVHVLGRSLYWMLEYFNGHSPNGQFYQRRIEYFGVGLHLYY